MKTVWIKMHEVKAEVLVPLSSILYVLYEYDPNRANVLSPNYDPERPYGHAVHFFCRENKRFGELFMTKEDAVERMREVQDAMEGKEVEVKFVPRGVDPSVVDA